MQKKWLKMDVELEDNIAIVFSQLSMKMKKNFIETTLNFLNADTVDQTTANLYNFLAKLNTKSVAKFISTSSNTTQKKHQDKKNTTDTNYKKKPNAIETNVIDKFVADMNAIGEKFIAGGD